MRAKSMAWTLLSAGVGIVFGFSARLAYERLRTHEIADTSKRNQWAKGISGGEWYVDETGEIAGFRRAWNLPIYWFGSRAEPSPWWQAPQP